MEIFTDVMDVLATILPNPPTGTPNELLTDGVEFFEVWLKRIGGFVAFAGAIKLALNLRTDDTKEQLSAVLIMVAGFMISDAVSAMDIFNIPATYTEASANIEFDSIVDFIAKWIRRVGAFGILLGSITIGFSIKDNDASSKVTGIKSLIVGAMVVAITGILKTFI